MLMSTILFNVSKQVLDSQTGKLLCLFSYINIILTFLTSDGTVPLLSLGYMCAPSGGWKKHANLYNPGHSLVVLREYENEMSPSKLDVRGGYKASDHIDILGNWEMTVSNLFFFFLVSNLNG